MCDKCHSFNLSLSLNSHSGSQSRFLAGPVPQLVLRGGVSAHEPSQFNQAVDQAIERMGSYLKNNKIFCNSKGYWYPENYEGSFFYFRSMFTWG